MKQAEFEARIARIEQTLERLAAVMAGIKLPPSPDEMTEKEHIMAEASKWCRARGLSRGTLLVRNRSFPVVQQRHKMFRHLAKRFSCRQIAEAFGQNRTTVHHAVHYAKTKK